MESQQPRSGRNVVNGTLRGSFRSVRLGWTDAVTGERLLVETSGDAAFFRALGAQGFERLRDSASHSVHRRPAHASARASSGRELPWLRPSRGSAAG